MLDLVSAPVTEKEVRLETKNDVELFTVLKKVLEGGFVQNIC